MRVFRNTKDRNELLVLLEWDELERAHHFFQSEEVRQRMHRAGVTEQPDIVFLEEVERTSA